MDITYHPPTSILSQHSHHIYHSSLLHRPMIPQVGTMPILMASAMPRNGPGSGMRYEAGHGCPSNPVNRLGSSSKRKIYEPPPPEDGSSPISLLPDDLIIEILGYLNMTELLALRPTSQRFSELALSPTLHTSLTLSTLPPYPLPKILKYRILPYIKHLHLHLFPYPSPTYGAYGSHHPSSTLLALLETIPVNQLRSLSLPFSAPYLHNTELCNILQKLGGKLERLDLRGSGLVGYKWIDQFQDISKNGRGLRELDLGFTGIVALPEGGSSVFRNLEKLSLSSCAGLQARGLAGFLADLPPKLQNLDLSRLEQVSFPALWNLRAIYHPDIEEMTGTEPTGLREIKLVGIDHLTRQNIRRLKAHWEEQRRSCFPLPPPPNYLDNQEIIAPIPIRSKNRVWGEPRTPPMPPSRTLNQRQEGRSAEMSPGSSFQSTTSSLSTLSSSRTTLRTPPTGIVIARTMPWMSPGDADEFNTSKLPNHPYLPSRSNPSGLLSFDKQNQKQRERPKTPESLNTIYLGQGKYHQENPGVHVNIVHSAILESEDEAGYRQFIGEVTGGVVMPNQDYGVGVGLGLGLGMGMGIGMAGWQGDLGFGDHAIAET